MVVMSTMRMISRKKRSRPLLPIEGKDSPLVLFELRLREKDLPFKARCVGPFDKKISPRSEK